MSNATSSQAMIEDEHSNKKATKTSAVGKRTTSQSRAATPKKAPAAKKATKKTSAGPTSATAKPDAKAKADGSVKPKKASEKKSVKTATKTTPAVKAKNAPATQDLTPSNDEDKPKIAPAPMRPALRVAKRAEARRDKNQTFKVNTQIIYPAHGVGFVAAMEKQSIADLEVELFVIDFEHEKMKLRVPVAKAAASGMRNLSTVEQIDDAMALIEGRARIKRTMWSRRAQEYEAKINSGDLVSVAEVVRDLYRADDQPEQSYSERQLFEQARERFGREVAAVRKKSLEKAIEEIHSHLAKRKGGAATEV